MDRKAQLWSYHFPPNYCIIVVPVKIPGGLLKWNWFLSPSCAETVETSFWRKTKKEERLHHLPPAKTTCKAGGIRIRTGLLGETAFFFFVHFSVFKWSPTSEKNKCKANVSSHCSNSAGVEEQLARPRLRGGADRWPPMIQQLTARRPPVELRWRLSFCKCTAMFTSSPAILPDVGVYACVCYQRIIISSFS